MAKIYENLHFGLKLQKFSVQIIGNPNIGHNFPKIVFLTKISKISNLSNLRKLYLFVYQMFL